MAKLQEAGVAEPSELHASAALAEPLDAALRALGEQVAAVHAALQAGYRHIDCAAVYQNEGEVGEALDYALSRGFVSRQDLYVCSKVW